MAQINDLKAEAEQLGIDVGGRWSDARIKAEIEAKKAELALAEKPEGDEDANLGEQVKTEQAEKSDAEADAKNAGGTGETGEQVAKPTGIVVKNISKNPTWVTPTKRCLVGDTVTIDGQELVAKKKSILHAIELGFLEVVE